MKTERNILIAFVLNLAFAVFEFFGGIFTGSVAIVSDAVHDLGDATSIGVAFFLERKSKRKPDEKYTYGYTRYSIIGGFVTSLLLLISSFTVVLNAVIRIFNPVEINYDGMIIFAVVGVAVNFLAAFFTREKGTLNQKAVNLHMLEDVLGWIAVLVGAIVMRFTNFSLLDPILSICVAVFIAVNAVGNLKEAFAIFLDKTPHGINIQEIKEHLCEIEGVQGVHHIHVWSLDGHNHCATLHIVTNDGNSEIKAKIREELKEHGIGHATIECERLDEPCGEEVCRVKHTASPCAHAHHHHAHHHSHG
jgi:cobalt-zinc-cadmium efflux system protein